MFVVFALHNTENDKYKNKSCVGLWTITNFETDPLPSPQVCNNLVVTWTLKLHVPWALRPQLLQTPSCQSPEAAALPRSWFYINTKQVFMGSRGRPYNEWHRSEARTMGNEITKSSTTAGSLHQIILGFATSECRVRRQWQVVMYAMWTELIPGTSTRWSGLDKFRAAPPPYFCKILCARNLRIRHVGVSG